MLWLNVSFVVQVKMSRPLVQEEDARFSVKRAPHSGPDLNKLDGTEKTAESTPSKGQLPHSFCRKWLFQNPSSLRSNPLLVSALAIPPPERERGRGEGPGPGAEG